jgi:hypothetical protein
VFRATFISPPHSVLPFLEARDDIRDLPVTIAGFNNGALILGRGSGPAAMGTFL